MSSSATPATRPGRCLILLVALQLKARLLCPGLGFSFPKALARVVVPWDLLCYLFGQINLLDLKLEMTYVLFVLLEARTPFSRGSGALWGSCTRAGSAGFQIEGCDEIALAQGCACLSCAFLVWMVFAFPVIKGSRFSWLVLKTISLQWGGSLHGNYHPSGKQPLIPNSFPQLCSRWLSHLARTFNFLRAGENTIVPKKTKP